MIVRDRDPSARFIRQRIYRSIADWPNARLTIWSGGDSYAVVGQRQWDRARLIWPVKPIAALAVPLLLTLGRGSAQVEPRWNEARTAHASVFYQDGYSKDAGFVRTWLDAAERLMTTKYGVTPAAYRISVYLHAGPTSNATVNQALSRCCMTGESGVHTGTIDILAPSAPAWKVANPRSSLGMPKADDNYHAKVLMSEYITIGHYAVQDGRPAGGWKYPDAPQWFVQGLQDTTRSSIPPTPIVTRRRGGFSNGQGRTAEPSTAVRRT